MIGIYLITNLINGFKYVGQSINIKRRFYEHKIPNDKGKIDKAIKEIGIDNFKFEVLEECEKEELLTKELFYIKKLNPEYNYIGKNKTMEERKKISTATKKWWNQLPSETKEKIIKNNLIGPKKGHSVSEETRNKIRQWVNENQGTSVMIVETKQKFKRIKDLENFLGACKGTCAAYWKGKIKSVKGYHVVKCRD